jgi:hypothetical protein
MRSTWWVVVLALGHAGCLRSTEYRCSQSEDCGAAGTCEPVGYCSVVDAMCASGARFTDAAGSYANQCVGSGDGGVDGTTIDAAIDAPSPGCPAGYAPLAGAQATHRYRLIQGPANWNSHRTFCTSTSAAAYLAVPGDLPELQAIAALAGAARIWVGISDTAIEGTWVTVQGTPQTFLPWGPGEPDVGSSDDCVLVDRGQSTMADERCNQQLVAVCECEP